MKRFLKQKALFFVKVQCTQQSPELFLPEAVLQTLWVSFSSTDAILTDVTMYGKFCLI